MEFRYRYDTETGLYYLQSRYYNPEWGRFINADGIAAVTGELLSANMFVYCKNNPVNMHDATGFRAVSGFGDDEDYEDYRRTARDRNNEENKLGDRDTKNRDNRQINRTAGNRGTKEREEKSGYIHDGKKKSGKKNNNNFNNKDLEEGNYYGASMAAPLLITAGAGLIVGTIIEDVFTGGLGIADDGVSISAGLGLIFKAFAF